MDLLFKAKRHVYYLNPPFSFRITPSKLLYISVHSILGNVAFGHIMAKGSGDENAKSVA